MAFEIVVSTIDPEGRTEEVARKDWNPNTEMLDHFTLDEWRGWIGGGWIEQVVVDSRLIAVVDEEGLLKSLDPNMKASQIAGQLLVGKVALARRMHKDDVKTR